MHSRECANATALFVPSFGAGTSSLNFKKVVAGALMSCTYRSHRRQVFGSVVERPEEPGSYESR